MSVVNGTGQQIKVIAAVPQSEATCAPRLQQLSSIVQTLLDGFSGRFSTQCDGTAAAEAVVAHEGPESTSAPWDVSGNDIAGGQKEAMKGTMSRTTTESTEFCESQPRHRAPPASDFEGDVQDPMDNLIHRFFQQHPAIAAKHTFQAVRLGIYEIDGREVEITWQSASTAAANLRSELFVVDGPLHQPFSDYMEMSDVNANYDDSNLRHSLLHEIPSNKRVSFHDQHKVYSRVQAMTIATQQARIREEAASFVKDGKMVPPELMVSYKKALHEKLGPKRQPSASSSSSAPAEADKLKQEPQQSEVSRKVGAVPCETSSASPEEVRRPDAQGHTTAASESARPPSLWQQRRTASEADVRF